MKRRRGQAMPHSSRFWKSVCFTKPMTGACCLAVMAQHCKNPNDFQTLALCPNKGKREMIYAKQIDEN